MLDRRALVLTLGAALAVAGGTAAAEPRALVEETVHDFGVVARGQTVRHVFVLRNDGSERLVVERVKMTDSALSARAPKSVVGGADGRVTLELDTEHVRGPVAAAALLYTNSTLTPVVSFELAGIVEWPIDIRPQAVAFLSAFEGERTATTLTVVNNREEPLVVAGLVPSSECIQASLETVREGREYALAIAAAAGTPPGRYEESVAVLAGTDGADRVIVPVHLLVKRALHAGPDRLDFGTVRLARVQQDARVAASLSQSVFISSAGLDGFEVEVESLSPAVRVDVTPDGPSSRFRLDVALVPEKLVAGPFTGTIRVVPSDPRLPELQVPYAGIVY
jgi:hypothetical protein